MRGAVKVEGLPVELRLLKGQELAEPKTGESRGQQKRLVVSGRVEAGTASAAHLALRALGAPRRCPHLGSPSSGERAHLLKGPNASLARWFSDPRVGPVDTDPGEGVVGRGVVADRVLGHR